MENNPAGATAGHAVNLSEQAHVPHSENRETRRRVRKLTDEQRAVIVMADIIAERDPELSNLMRRTVMPPETFGQWMGQLWGHRIRVSDVILFGLSVLTGWGIYSIAAYYLDWPGGVFGVKNEDGKTDKNMLDGAKPVSAAQLRRAA
jgi:hypothetical protein